MKVYEKLAQSLYALQNCQKTGNRDWEIKHKEIIDSLIKGYMPSGSGIDSGTRFLFDESNPEKLVFQADYHHMDENGYYDGWTEHKVIITPSLSSSFNIQVTGSDRNDIKEYYYDIFSESLEKLDSL